MKYAKIVILVVITFYYCFPQALNVAGSSFIFFSGILGLGLYSWHRFPFKETMNLIAALILLVFTYITCMAINGGDDGGYAIGYAKSNIAWIFTAYLIVFILFNIHKRPTFHTLLYYFVGVIAIQCFIATAMYFNEGLKDFLLSIQLQTDISQEAVDTVENQRLVGYGTGFFGAGAICGLGLILTGYLLIKSYLDNKKFILLALTYTFIFFIGLFMARTTTIGLAFSLMLMTFLYFTDERANKKNMKRFVVSFGVLIFIGVALASVYFSAFTDWAFELFRNFFQTGEFSTQSSDGMFHMLYAPSDAFTYIFGRGNMHFFGSDIGYTRLIFYSGIIGTIMFFLYPMAVAKLSFTKDWSINILMLVMIVYVMVLNLKGLIDQTPMLYPIFFYFMFYKYYIYMPKLYAQARLAHIEQRANMLNQLRK